MTRRESNAFARAFLGAAFVLVQALPAAANDPCSGIPNCTLQQQAPISLKEAKPQGWAFYCSGSHPYYWGLAWAGNTGRWVQTDKCFSTAENAQAEDTPNKLDVTLDNFCTTRDYTISLACSANTPPKFTPPACGSGSTQTVFTDPNCPSSTKVTSTCSTGTLAPVCFQTWAEQCSNNTTWSCTLDVGITSCQGCSGSP